jgi:hypothetical protein
MTVKEALKSLVDELDEAEASRWLAEMERRLVPDWRARSFPPPQTEIARMTLAERDEVARRWPPDIDLDEVADWDEGTLSDVDLIDE